MKPSSFKMAFLMVVPVLAFARGGVSGGGGNVLYPVNPHVPAAPSEVQAAVPEARARLLDYLREKRSAWAEGRLGAAELADFGPLFSAENDILSVSASTAVDVETEEPCFDAARNPFDGSTLSDQKGAICLSALTISRRVERSDVPAQSAALLAHEYSEVVGFEEAQAVSLQTRVWRDFSGKR